MTLHQIRMIGGGQDEIATILEEEVNGLCRLVCEYRGKRVTADAHDYFEALSSVRLEMERDGLIPFCYGASLNVFPSQMARQMGRGMAAYKMEMGEQASRQDLVRIFDHGPDIIPSPVARQKEYFNDWLASLNS